MAFNGSGVFSRLYNWENDASNGIKILASRQDTQWNDACTNGLSLCITKDGQQTTTMSIPFAQGISVTNGITADTIATTGAITNTGTTGFGGIYTSLYNASVASSGTASLSINAGGGSWSGILCVSSVRAGNANVRTAAQYAISARGTTIDGSTTLNTATAAGGQAFTLSYPSAGVVELTNNDANTSVVSMTWIGTNGA